jgi:cytochrome b subunit of formate dehydrogenase
MHRDTLRYLVDLCLAVTFFLCFFTGVAKFPGFLRAIGTLGVIAPLRDLSLIHDWSGVAMGGMVMIHLALNYRWIAGMTGAIIKKG